MKTYLIVHETRGLVIAVIPNTGFIHSKDPTVLASFENILTGVPLAPDHYKEKYESAEDNRYKFFECDSSNINDVWNKYPEIIEKYNIGPLIWVANPRMI